MSKHLLSVIVPIYNEEKYIAKCIESMLEQDYPKEELEIILVDGMSNDCTREIVETYTNKYFYLRMIDNPQRIASCAMNIGIEASKGDTIIRMDAHAEYPSDYFSILVKTLYELDGAENVGGVCVTLPCNETVTAVSIAECLSNKFGMGNSYFRVGAKNVMSVDTVPFGCFRKSLFDKIGLYDADMIRNQDDELNGRIIKNGGKIYLLPDVEIKYFARDKISKVRKMFYQYGLYKPLGNKKLGAPATIRQFFPLLFVLFLVIGLIASLLFPILFPIYFGVIVLHLAIGTCEGLKSAQKTNRVACCWIMPYIFLNMHVCYGIGYLKGMYNIAFHKSFEVRVNR